MSWNFEDQNIGSDNTELQQLQFLTHGLKLDYQIRPNWSLNLGFYIGQINIQYDSDLALSYNRTQESLNVTSGQIENQINVQTLTPLSTTDYTIDITLEESQVIMDGSLVEFKARDKVKLRTFQIPFGITHYFNLNKVRLFGRIGVMVNSFKFSDYKINQTTINDSEGSPIEIIGYSSRRLSPENNFFFSLYGELGLSIPIKEVWHINLSMSNRYNFLSENKSLDLQDSKLGSSWKLGLGYQF